jgi:hypothetical protein
MIVVGGRLRLRTAMPFPDLKTDKRGYVLFGCPQCPRKAKLLRIVAESRYRPETGMGLIIDMVRPNDCKSAACGFGVA